MPTALKAAPLVEGQSVYVELATAATEENDTADGGRLCFRGILVETDSEEVVVAVPLAARSLAEDAEAAIEVDGTKLTFVRTASLGCYRSRPVTWRGLEALRPWPNPSEVIDAYNAHMAAPPQIASTTEDGAAIPVKKKPPPSAPSAPFAPPSGPQTLLGSLLGGLVKDFGDPETADEEEEEAEIPPTGPKLGKGLVAPGTLPGTAPAAEKKKTRRRATGPPPPPTSSATP